MTRFLIILIIILLLFLFLIVFPLTVKGESARESANVLLITIDTLRPDRLSCYSHEHLQTPHIDRLAERGVVFTRAFAQTPMTLPSHATILLGTTPLYHGVHDNSNFIVREEFLTLAELFKSKGYSTGAFVGAFPLDSRFGLTQGFDVYDDHYGYKGAQEFTYVERRAEVVVERALEWLKGQREPWFLWIHCFDPHQRYDPPEPFRTQYQEQSYDGEVAYVDFALGKVFDHLEKNDSFDDTVVIFTGDHGESLGEHGEPTHGYFAYNSTIWIPLIITGPGIKAGRIEQHVCHSDIYPTVCDILGIEKPSFLQGVTLFPSLKGKGLPQRTIYFESLYPHYSRGWAPLRGYIEVSQKYIQSPIPELYDLEKDFSESENLAPKEKLNNHERELEKLIESLSYAGDGAKMPVVDKATLEKLRSLGYISSPQASKKENYSPKDDLKTLLPFQIKLMKSSGAYLRGELEESRRLLQEIIAERKDFDLAYSYLATLYKEKGEWREAIEVLRKGLEHNPSSLKIISTFGIFLVEVGQYDAAIDVLTKGLALIDYDPELWNYLGVAYWSRGDFQKALNAYEKVLTLDSNYPVVYNNLGSLFLSRAIKLKDADDLKRATQNFKKAIEIDPEYASAYNGLGSAYAQSGDADSAIYCWEKAVELRPDYVFSLYNLGLSYLSQGKKNKAFEFFSKYKEEVYGRLSEGEKVKLDSLIQQCQHRQ